MAKRIRTFIAVEISSEVREQLVGLQEELRAGEASVKWVEPENLHLTLKFLGEVDQHELYAVCKAVQREVESFTPFEMTVAGVGAFPTLRRPRVIWVGITTGAEELTEIHSALDKCFRALGYPHEDRRFTPHLTLGRLREIRSGSDLGGAIERLARFEAGTSSVRQILVMASLLTPDGPQYTVMGRAPLARASPE